MQEVRGNWGEKQYWQRNPAFKESHSNRPRPLNAPAAIVSSPIFRNMLTRMTTNTHLGTCIHMHVSTRTHTHFTCADFSVFPFFPQNEENDLKI